MKIKNNIFISYSRHDKHWLERFRTFIKPLTRSSLFDVWDDSKINPGENWRDAIEKALEEAQIAILLVTPNFLASDFIANEELPKILKKASNDGLIIYWLYISHCLYEETELVSFQAAHDLNESIDSLKEPEQDKIFVSIGKKIKNILHPIADDILKERQAPSNTISHTNLQKKTNEELAKEYYKIGVKHIENKKWEEALSSFNDAIIENEMFANAYCNRGFVRIQLDELRDAITDFEKAIRFDPTLWEAHHSLGILHIANKQKDKGCDCLRLAKTFGMSESENAYKRHCI
ncbi:MAG: TIR domain-containing protein [Saprospiraceae bacterium]|nr:TIR domain-containing protein [Saprospiraceae bacterium]